MDKFILEREQEILFFSKRIRQFRTINLHHWIPVYKKHKENSKLLLTRAKDILTQTSK